MGHAHGHGGGKRLNRDAQAHKTMIDGACNKTLNRCVSQDYCTVCPVLARFVIGPIVFVDEPLTTSKGHAEARG